MAEMVVETEAATMEVMGAEISEEMVVVRLCSVCLAHLLTLTTGDFGGGDF